MSNRPDPQRTLEVKIRPYSSQNNQERPDQRGVSRVHMSREALMELGLQSGQACYLWRKDEVTDADSDRREAVAWLTAEKNLSKKVIQMSKTFQEVCGFKLADDLVLAAAGNVDIAGSIVLRDVTEGSEPVPELKAEDKPHWEWFLRENLGRAEIVFIGMTFKGISLRGPRRTFTVVSCGPSSQGRYEETSSVAILDRDSKSAESLQPNGVSHRLEVTNVAGIDQALKKLNGFLNNFDRGFEYTECKRSCGTLLHGGRGTGKTFILDRIAKTGWGKVYRIGRGAKEATVRTTFKDAKLSQPSIILLDDIERIVGKDDSVSQDITDALGEELDSLTETTPSNYLPRVLVVAATREPSSIPLSLKKEGRFKTDIALPVPDAAARRKILKSLSPRLHQDVKDEVIDKVGDRTHAYTAEDLTSLLNAAYEIAEEKVDKTNGDVEAKHYLTEQDIEQALTVVRPTAMHDITLQPPSIRWDQIGGQEKVKKTIRQAIEVPLLYPDLIKRMGGSPKKGLLLYGPPGCSKTLTAQAIATEIAFNFFAVKGAELLNMYVGESERAVRTIFAQARAASPSIIFFDEIESIASKRERGGGGGRNNGAVNVLTTLLNEMDGIETLKGVMVVAATNQPQALDLALLRPGRFDKLLYVAPPDLAGREEILRVRKRKMDLADDVDMAELARLTDGYSGAEVVGICEGAIDTAIGRCLETGDLASKVSMGDFLEAMKGVKKQITREMILGYERWAVGARGGAD